MIKVENLSKSFGPKLAVDNISFSLERGEVLGFLGPNGAGKSTTMRMITGFIPPNSGKVTVGGYSILGNPISAKSLIGYLPENAPSYADMTVSGFLNFTAELRGLSGAEKRNAIGRVVEMCFLQPVYHQSIETLSKGFRHRTCFAQSIIHDPDVLVLDEPTDGLDPNQKHEVRTLIRRMGQKKAIIFSTHILEEVEAACTRAIIIDRGRVVANGTPAQLKAKSSISGAVMLVMRGIDADSAVNKLSALAGANRARIIEKDDDKIVVRVFPKPDVADGELSRGVAELVAKEKWKIEELHTEEGRLDEVFRKITLPETENKEEK